MDYSNAFDDEVADAAEAEPKKRGGWTKSQDQKNFDAAKARTETAKADHLELDLKVKLRQYVSRAAVQQAAATTVAAFAQTCRSLPDSLERELGLDAQTVAAIGLAIDAALDDLAGSLELLAEPTL